MSQEGRMSRELRATIEWRRDGVVVKSIDGFDLPPRTGLNMALPVPLISKPPGTVEKATISISGYKCVDCGFETDSFNLMMEHQRSGKHSLWQGIKRFFGSVGYSSATKGIYRCKECGEISYSGKYCLHCDRNYWKFAWRRGWLQVWLPGVACLPVGIIINLTTHHPIGWVIWGIGMALIFAAIANVFTWGKTIIKKKFEPIKDPLEQIIREMETIYRHRNLT